MSLNHVYRHLQGALFPHTICLPASVCTDDALIGITVPVRERYSFTEALTAVTHIERLFDPQSDKRFQTLLVQPSGQASATLKCRVNIVTPKQWLLPGDVAVEGLLRLKTVPLFGVSNVE